MRSYFDALGSVAGVVSRSRPLRRVKLAFAFFKTTETATWIAMLVYAFERGGVTESGLLAAAVLVPAAIIAPLAAAVADRYRPGVALLFGYVMLALSCLAVAAAMADGFSRFPIYALLGTVAVAATLIRPSQVVFAPAFARTPDELTATNVVSNWIESLSTLVASSSRASSSPSTHRLRSSP